MSVDLTQHVKRTELARLMQADLDAFCRSEFAEDPRKHLGASIIGHDCQAYAWSVWRWLHHEEFDGRMLRLFNRGHEEERRFVRWLQGIGFTCHELNPETKKQFRITGAKGHFGGSLDSVLIAPARYYIAEPLLGEFKTHNQKSFDKLKLSGVQAAKPQHYRQMCSYGRAFGFRFGLYCAVNKNDDEIHFEIVWLDWRQADDLFRKAESIIFSQQRPQKIAQTATFFECKYCDFAGLCHGSQAPTKAQVPAKNCRSCINAYPVEGGQWLCKPRQAIIPDNVIAIGCPSWSRIA